MNLVVVNNSSKEYYIKTNSLIPRLKPSMVLFVTLSLYSYKKSLNMLKGESEVVHRWPKEHKTKAQ